MTSEEILKTVDLQKISEEGSKIYEKIKTQYEQSDNGKFLAIDIDTGNVYLGATSTEAVEIARKIHPDKVFYVIKIGHSTAETLASIAAE